MFAPRTAPVAPLQALLALAVAAAAAGCASGPQSPLEPAEPVLDGEGPPPGAEPTDAPPPGPGPGDGLPRSPPAATATGGIDEPDPGAKFREITPRECQALAGKYGELTRSDETAKLNPKLTDAQRAQATASIDAAARTLEGRWVESCSSSLLGKVAEEAAITCAMSAKNVAEFDTCLNGPK